MALFLTAVGAAAMVVTAFATWRTWQALVSRQESENAQRKAMLYREMGQLLLEPLDSNQQFYILSLSAEIKALNLLPAAEELLLSIPLEAGELSQEEKLDRMTRIERILFDR